jgi:hypothetical protein
MDLDQRAKTQHAFSREARILVSTDAGGEGLNLQFCHVVVNFDMPWNPMRVEQRIGRVDRISQRHVVRAVNFVLDETVEHRVRQVLEEKLEVIAQEFGVDKAADVMDSVEVEPLFDELFVQGLQNPELIEQECEAVISQMRVKLAETRKDTGLLGEPQAMDATEARKWRDHPAQFWLERAITNGIASKGGNVTRTGNAWRIRWADGSESAPVCFDARTAEDNPDYAWITLEDPRARALIVDLPRWIPGQPLPCVRIAGLPDAIKGVWSLWEINLSAEGFNRKRYLPIFAADDGRTYIPTAKRVWDLLLTEQVELEPFASDAEESERWFHTSLNAAHQQGEQLFADLSEAHKHTIKEERDRASYAYESRYQAIGRIGLPAVREHRRKRLDQEHQARLARIAEAEAAIPDLNAVMLLRIGKPDGR